MNFVDENEKYISSPSNGSFIEQRAELYAAAIHEKTNSLSNCIGFIDGTNAEIARPIQRDVQTVVYSGHKRMHCLGFQVVLYPDRLIM